MRVEPPNRRCQFCNKRLPKLNHKQMGSPPRYCVRSHRRYLLQLRYLTGLRERLLAVNTKV